MGTRGQIFTERMAPIHLLPLIEIYCSPAQVSCPHVKSHVGELRPIDDLIAMGLIEVGDDDSQDSHGYVVTEKGSVYVEAVLATPMPVKTWTVVRDDYIKSPV